MLIPELSRLGRNMLEVLNIINSLAENRINIVFVRQPELSTNGSHGKLLLAIYSYFAQTEREFISTRTKQGLAAIKASGRILGRPKGSKNIKGRILDPFKSQVMDYLRLDLSIASIVKIINSQLTKKLTYCSYVYYIQHDKDLFDALKMRKLKKSLVSAYLPT